MIRGGRGWSRRLSLIALLFAGLDSAAMAADGDLDLTFHTADGGVFHLGSPNDAATVQAVPAPDGTTLLLVARSDGVHDLGIWLRVSANGASSPCALTTASLPDFVPDAAAFDSSGRLLVLGTSSQGELVVVERFLYPSCALDPDFDGNGVASYLPNEFPLPTTILVLPVGQPPLVSDRYYLVATRLNPIIEVVVLRLKTSGAVDTAWGGGDGLVELATPGADFSGAEDAVVDAAGRIVIAGFAQFPDGQGDHLNRITVYRLLASGALDSSFDGNGMKLLPFDLDPPSDDLVNAVATSTDGHIAVTGTVDRGSTRRLGVAVVREDGAEETSFDTDGRVTYGLASRYATIGESIAFRSDGSLVVAGTSRLFATPPYHDDSFVVRLRPDGSLDPGFGGNGFTFPPVEQVADGDDAARALALVAGRPLVGGYAKRSGGSGEGYLLRLQDHLIFADGFESGSDAAW